MNVELSNPGVFKDAFDSISHICDEVKLDFSQDNGMRLCALDKSHIVFIELEFKVTLFDEFDCPVPEKVIIDTGKFMDILKRMKKNILWNGKTHHNQRLLNFKKLIKNRIKFCR